MTDSGVDAPSAPSGPKPGPAANTDRIHADLLARVSIGDRTAYATIYQQFASRMWGVAYRILRDSHLAEDAAQEALLQAWTQACRFDPAQGRADSWLLRLAHTRAVDRLRSLTAARRAEQRGRTAHVLDAVDHDDPCVRIIERFEQSQVKELLDGVPPAQAQALILAYYQGLTRLEIAQRLGIPLGTVKWRSLNGLRLLSEAIAAADR